MDPLVALGKLDVLTVDQFKAREPHLYPPG